MKPSKNILLVEDDKDDQFFFVEALKKIEDANLFDVADDGKAALDSLQNSNILPTHIFMDIEMPGMDGIECLKEIINNPRTKNIPVIMLSSSTNHVIDVEKLGARAFIKKPNDVRTLLLEVEQLINTDFMMDPQNGNTAFRYLAG